MDGQIVHIKISNEGKLQFYNVASLQQLLSLYKNWDGFITFHESKKDYESLHRLYYWWVSLISDHTGNSKEDTDLDLCQMFLSYPKYNPLSKKTNILVKSKDDLTYKEWVCFLRDINTLCVENLSFVDKQGNSTLPIPNNLKGKV